ncbi:MAG TPA: TonB-dependent receptor [Bryobacteraceae bacterium]|nr:TonB-dependent receptor [Bryobacteraceae bacterium]
MTIVRSLGAAIFFSALAFSQFDSATVLGTVRDSAQATIAGATVTLTNTATGVVTQQETDSNGDFQFVNVRPAPYVLKVEKTGFAAAAASPFTVTVGTRQRVDLTLQIASVSEAVTVSAAASQLETDTSARGHAMQATEIVNLPLNGRSYADLALLAPGVRRSTLNVTPDGGSLRDASYNINGMRSSLNNFLIDGLDNNAYGTSNQGFSNQVVQLSPDAVQEFRIDTTNFSAEFGRAGGGVINATVKSGSNQYHGAAWDFLRNTSLNAVGFFKPRENRKPTLQQNQFGATFGGPIKKDKMFFFADYEGYRRVRRALNLSTLPTVDQRSGNLGIPVANPLTGELFANGVIPQSAITPFARKVLGDLPAPNRAGLANNFESLPRQTDQNDKGDIRLDYYISNKLNFFFRYSHRLANNFEPPPIPGSSGGNSNGNIRVLSYQAAYGLTYALSARTVAEFRMAVSQTEGGKFPVFIGQPAASTAYGITGLPEDPRFAGGLYAQSVGGYAQFGQQSSNPQFQNPYVINPKGNLTQLMGRHSVKMGVEYQRLDTAIDDFNPKYGQDNYGSRFSVPAGTTSSNNLYNLADFMFGLRNRYALNNAVIVNYQQRMYFGYVQDDFKVNSKLTLNMGLRYEFATPQWERDNILTNYDPATNSLVQAKDGSLFDRSRVNPDRNNFAPRFGFAYNATPKTVVRGGFGVSYIHFNRLGGENLLAYNLPGIIGVGIDQIPSQGRCTANQAPLTCFRPTQDGYPSGLLSPAFANPLGIRTNYIPADTRTGYTMNWHFTVQREIVRNLVLDVAYVGNRSNKLVILSDYNEARFNNPGENLTINARRPVPGFGQIQIAQPAGFSNYNALQAKIERRFSKGFLLLNTFVWSKTIDNASGHLETSGGDDSRVSFTRRNSYKGPSGYNQPLNNTFTVIWEIPFGKGKRFGGSMPRIADHVIGGWNISQTTTANSGLPVNLVYSPVSRLQVGSIGNIRANIIGNPILPESQRPIRELYLNRDTVQEILSNNATVADPYGNSGRNNVRAPGYFGTDMGVHKRFSVRESMFVEFRAEFFNLFNRTNLLAPDSNRSNPTFGLISGTFPARQGQFALKLVF